jgi:hypothetical protein
MPADKKHHRHRAIHKVIHRDIHRDIHRFVHISGDARGLSDVALPLELLRWIHPPNSRRTPKGDTSVPRPRVLPYPGHSESRRGRAPRAGENRLCNGCSPVRSAPKWAAGHGPSASNGTGFGRWSAAAVLCGWARRRVISPPGDAGRQRRPAGFGACVSTIFRAARAKAEGPGRTTECCLMMPVSPPRVWDATPSVGYARPPFDGRPEVQADLRGRSSAQVRTVRTYGTTPSVESRGRSLGGPQWELLSWGADMSPNAAERRRSPGSPERTHDVP